MFRARFAPSVHIPVYIMDTEEIIAFPLWNKVLYSAAASPSPRMDIMSRSNI